MTNVQISPELLFASSVFELTQLLKGATETTRSYGRKIKNRDDQLQRIYREREEARTQARETLEQNATLLTALEAAGEEVRELQETVAHRNALVTELQGEVESLRNALDERGRMIDHLQKQRPIQVGDRVRVLPNPKFVSGTSGRLESATLSEEGEVDEVRSAYPNGNLGVGGKLIHRDSVERVA